ncbi:hypothetical protein LGK95_06465 [Clostridium algoriphilum]|uniref:hypothetical protein n=1 Tax=Clostridium algoriphilum TaxID=198347 RepID=UPI001CF4AFB3|nr:hypothetical protein [Clostridium algoriphilum]MCB2293167.1 hypothetical protein [Clostridium algoriphilum]
MDILCVCNEKMLKSVMLEAIFNKICIIDNITSNVKYISLYIKKINDLKTIDFYCSMIKGR